MGLLSLLQVGVPVPLASSPGSFWPVSSGWGEPYGGGANGGFLRAREPVAIATKCVELSNGPTELFQTCWLTRWVWSNLNCKTVNLVVSTRSTTSLIGGEGNAQQSLTPCSSVTCNKLSLRAEIAWLSYLKWAGMFYVQDRNGHVPSGEDIHILYRSWRLESVWSHLHEQWVIGVFLAFSYNDHLLPSRFLLHHTKEKMERYRAGSHLKKWFRLLLNSQLPLIGWVTKKRRESLDPGLEGPRMRMKTYKTQARKKTTTRKAKETRQLRASALVFAPPLSWARRCIDSQHSEP